MAVIDWSIRSAVSWATSIAMDVAFCLEALDMALQRRPPEIFNTDQRAQFTSLAFTERLKQDGMRISIDGRSRALDNVFVERLWRSVKYDEVYVRNYQSAWDARHSWARFFVFYHEERLHQAWGYRPPAAVYLGSAMRYPHGRHLAMECTGHPEDFELRLYCRKNGLDNGGHFILPRTAE
jgi:putative transposase